MTPYRRPTRHPVDFFDTFFDTSGLPALSEKLGTSLTPPPTPRFGLPRLIMPPRTLVYSHTLSELAHFLLRTQKDVQTLHKILCPTTLLGDLKFDVQQEQELGLYYGLPQQQGVRRCGLGRVDWQSTAGHFGSFRCRRRSRLYKVPQNHPFFLVTCCCM